MSANITTTTIQSEAKDEFGSSTCKDVVTTSFIDDGTVVCGDYNHQSISDSLPIVDQSLKDFFLKPYFVGNFDWTTSNTEGTQISTNSIASLLNGNTIWTNKMSGYNLKRGTAVLRVQLNANPFQQGKLLINFLPCATQFATYDPSYVAMHNAKLTTRRMTPCLEIDCRDTTGILTIPYVAPTHWYCATMNTYDWGSYYISVLSPLLTGASGSTKVSVSVWLHFEDFEFAGPLVPQSHGGKKKYSAKSFSRDNASEEADSSTLSELLHSGSTLAGSFSAVPSLAPLAAPASWALSAASGVASYFGWSKPLVEAIPMPMMRNTDKYACTADGVVNAIPTSIMATNRLSLMTTNSLTDQDEMSFNFLKKVSTVVPLSGVPAAAVNIAWHDTDADATSLVSFQMGPNVLYAEDSIVNGGVTAYYQVGSPLFYMYPDFAFWRGSFDIVIKFAKTDFHSGRLVVSWTPTSNITNTPTLATGELAIREIIDLNSGSEFHFNLPFINNANYLDTLTYSGQLDIVVLNALTHPETANAKINFMVFVAGGDDFEYAAPCASQIYNGNTNQVPFWPQMGGMIDDTPVVIDEVIGGQVVEPSTNRYAQQSVGEVFTSVKQILNRNCAIYSNQALSTTIYDLWPWFSGVVSQSAGTPLAPPLGGDMYSKYSNMYAFYRGGMRVKVIRSGSTGTGIYSRALNTTTFTPLIAQATYTINSASTSWQSTGKPLNNISYNVTEGTDTSGLISVPYYGKYKCSLKLNQTSATAQITVDDSQPRTIVTANIAGALSRSCNDDFQFSYFLGPPPLKVATV